MDKSRCFRQKYDNFGFEYNFPLFENLEKYTLQYLKEINSVKFQEKNDFINTFLKIRFYHTKFEKNEISIIQQFPIFFTIICLRDKFDHLTKLMLFKIQKFISMKSENNEKQIHYLFLDEFICNVKIFFNAALEIEKSIEKINEIINMIQNNLNFISNEENSFIKNELTEFSIYRMLIYIWNKNVIFPIKDQLINSLGIVMKQYLINSFEKQESKEFIGNFISQVEKISNEKLSLSNLFYKKISPNNDFFNKNFKATIEKIEPFDCNNGFIDFKQKQSFDVLKNFEEEMVINSEYFIENTLFSLLNLDISETNFLFLNKLDFSVSEIYNQAENELINKIKNFLTNKLNENMDINKIEDIFNFFNQQELLNKKLILRTSFKINNAIAKDLCSFLENKLVNDLELFFVKNIKSLYENYFSRINQGSENSFFFKINENIFKRLEEKYIEKYDKKYANEQEKNQKEIISNFLNNEGICLMNILFYNIKNFLNRKDVIESQKKANKDSFISDYKHYIVKKEILNNFIEYILYNFLLNLNTNKNFIIIEKIIDSLLTAQKIDYFNFNYIEKCGKKNIDIEILNIKNFDNDTNPINKILSSFNVNNDYYLAEFCGLRAENLKINYEFEKKINDFDDNFIINGKRHDFNNSTYSNHSLSHNELCITYDTSEIFMDME